MGTIRWLPAQTKGQVLQTHRAMALLLLLERVTQ
jgi:hypothetical protein